MNSAIAIDFEPETAAAEILTLSRAVRQPAGQTLKSVSVPAPSAQQTPPQRAPLLLTTENDRAEVHRIAGYVARGALEVLAGARQPQQLSSILNPSLYRSLLARAELSKRARATNREKFATLHQGVQARSVHSCLVAPEIYELSVVVSERSRYRALAMRVEKQGGNWKVTALLIG